MKINLLICSALATSLLAGCAWEKCAHCQKNTEARQAKLMAEAKVSQEDAQKTALAKVPGGAVKESELEKEHGKLIWSFDIATPDSKDIMEVEVDAVTGAVLGVDKETAEAAGKAKQDKD